MKPCEVWGVQGPGVSVLTQALNLTLSTLSQTPPFALALAHDLFPNTTLNPTLTLIYILTFTLTPTPTLIHILTFV